MSVPKIVEKRFARLRPNDGELLPGRALSIAAILEMLS